MIYFTFVRPKQAIDMQRVRGLTVLKDFDVVKVRRQRALQIQVDVALHLVQHRAGGELHSGLECSLRHGSETAASGTLSKLM